MIVHINPKKDETGKPYNELVVASLYENERSQANGIIKMSRKFINAL